MTAAILQKIAHMLATRTGSTCPSEIARALAPQRWRRLMPAVHETVANLHAAGEVAVTQKGRAIPAWPPRGPYRISRKTQP